MNPVPKAVAKALASSTPIAPICEQYLEMSTLGTKEDRAAIVEHFAEVFTEYRGDGVTKAPHTLAREIVKEFDPVTINLMTTAFDRGTIKFDVFKKVRANTLVGIQGRHYILMQIAISGLEAKSGSYRQFMGLYEMVGDPSAGHASFEISMETDEKFKRHAACMRYAVMVTNGLDMRQGEGMFLRRNSEDLVVDPHMHQLLCKYPDDADRIAQIVMDRKAQEPVMIEQILDGTVIYPLGSGAL